MKIGLFYKNKENNELLMLHNFTRTYYVWLNCNGEKIEEDKWLARKHISSVACHNQSEIDIFLKNFQYKVTGICYKCNKLYESNFKKYINEIAYGDEKCPVCGDILKY